MVGHDRDQLNFNSEAIRHDGVAGFVIRGYLSLHWEKFSIAARLPRGATNNDTISGSPSADARFASAMLRRGPERGPGRFFDKN
jgi:hypothetical protein